MSEWWTYRPSDFLLFSQRTYDRLFELYNADIWPLHLLALLAGIAILALTRIQTPWSGRAIAAILSACWLWIAWAFLWQRYSTINWIAPYLAAGFAIEALLLLWFGVLRNRLTFAPNRSVREHLGVAVFVFALLLQPLAGLLVGRHWTGMELFGVTPDPTAVATIGLLLAARPINRVASVMPLLWCVFSGLTLYVLSGR